MHLFAGLRRALNFFSGGILLAHVQHVCNLSRFFLLSKRLRAAPSSSSAVCSVFLSSLRIRRLLTLLCSTLFFCVGVPFSFHASNRGLRAWRR